MERFTLKTYDLIAEDYDKNWNKMNVSKNSRQKFKELVKRGKVVDIGCGSGNDTKYFSKKFDIVGVDSSEGMVNLARKKFPSLKFILQDMRQISFPENSISGAWISQSLLHIPKSDGMKFLKKLKKALKPNGIVYICIREGNFEGLTNKSENSLLKGKKRYLSLYTRKEIEKTLTSLGYTILMIRKLTRKNGGEIYLKILAKSEQARTPKL